MVRDFEEALAGVIRETREAAGRRQDEIAAEARAWGLPWTPSTVAAIETGRRHVTALELLLLPNVLRGRGQEPPELPDLLERLGRIRLSDSATGDGSALALLARGQAVEAGKREWDVPLTRGVRAAFASVSAQARSYRDRYGVRMADLVLAEDEAAGEAERKAAGRLGVSALDVAVAARVRWGRSLTAERDARVGTLPAGANPRALRTLRGHVTRQLSAELRETVQGG